MLSCTVKVVNATDRRRVKLNVESIAEVHDVLDRKFGSNEGKPWIITYEDPEDNYMPTEVVDLEDLEAAVEVFARTERVPTFSVSRRKNEVENEVTQEQRTFTEAPPIQSMNDADEKKPEDEESAIPDPTPQEVFNSILEWARESLGRPEVIAPMHSFLGEENFNTFKKCAEDMVEQVQQQANDAFGSTSTTSSSPPAAEIGKADKATSDDAEKTAKTDKSMPDSKCCGGADLPSGYHPHWWVPPGGYAQPTHCCGGARGPGRRHRGGRPWQGCVWCDMCHEKLNTPIRYKCLTCPDYDLCERCYGTEHGHGHSFRKMTWTNPIMPRGMRHAAKGKFPASTSVAETKGRENASSAASGSESQKSNPSSSSLGHSLHFVEDVTVPDGTPVLPGSIFIKTWRVVNKGNTPTPDAAYVRFSHGNVFHEKSFVSLPQIEPGQTAEISVEFQVPNDATPGQRLRSYWMIASRWLPDRRAHWLWCDVEVIAPEATVATELAQFTQSTQTNADAAAGATKGSSSTASVASVQDGDDGFVLVKSKSVDAASSTADDLEKPEAATKDVDTVPAPRILAPSEEEELQSQLFSMSFCDRELNYDLIRNFNGDMVKIVNHLLTLQKEQK
eukprot:Clim_evm52s151 gene=Clim_evmTU52s151